MNDQYQLTMTTVSYFETLDLMNNDLLIVKEQLNFFKQNNTNLQQKAYYFIGGGNPSEQTDSFPTTNCYINFPVRNPAPYTRRHNPKKYALQHMDDVI